MTKDIIAILCTREKGYINHLDEVTSLTKCAYCSETVVYGDLVMREAQKSKDSKKYAEIKFICNYCYVKMPRFGKMIRPSLDMIKKIRSLGMDLDEIKIREMMHKIKNKQIEL